jgi:hypothetical protein
MHPCRYIHRSKYDTVEKSNTGEGPKSNHGDAIDASSRIIILLHRTHHELLITASDERNLAL